MFGEELCAKKVLAFGKVLVNYYNLGQFETISITQLHLGSIKSNSMVAPVVNILKYCSEDSNV